MLDYQIIKMYEYNIIGFTRKKTTVCPNSSATTGVLNVTWSEEVMDQGDRGGSCFALHSRAGTEYSKDVS